MKNYIILLAMLLSLTTYAQNQNTKQEPKASRLLELSKTYKINKKDSLFIDSLINIKLSMTNLVSYEKRKELIKNKLYLYQNITPTDAQIVRDTALGTYNEVIMYRMVTTIISDKHEKNSVVAFKQKLEELKKAQPIRLREQAEAYEKQAAELREKADELENKEEN